MPDVSVTTTYIICTYIHHQVLVSGLLPSEVLCCLPLVLPNEKRRVHLRQDQRGLFYPSGAPRTSYLTKMQNTTSHIALLQPEFSESREFSNFFSSLDDLGSCTAKIFGLGGSQFESNSWSVLWNPLHVSVSFCATYYVQCSAAI